jgi:hypothetical protein
VKIRAIRGGGRTRSNADAQRRRREESGFAYLMALFMVLVIIIGSEVVVQNSITLGRRERESELIWRGNQYVRAIRLYYHKTGHYPQSLDDLKTGLPDLHFLRSAAYKDPMNAEDGSWRFIYINGTGQIVGSVRYATLQQMAFMELAGCPATIYDGDSEASDESASSPPQTGFGTNATAGGSGSTNASASGTNGQGQPNPCAQPNWNASSSQPGASAGQNSLSGFAAATGLGATAPAQSSIAGSSITSSTSSSSSGQGFSPGQVPNPFAGLKPTGPVDEPVVGGFLTGVASKVDKPSIKVYKGGKKYKYWEFIWNPIEDQARAVQQGVGAAQQGGQIGQSLLNGLGAGLAGAMNNGAAATGLNGAAPGGATGAAGSQTSPTQAPTQPPSDQQQPNGPTQQPQ